MIRGSNIGIFLRSYPDLQTMNLVSGKKCAPLTQLTGHLSEADSFTGYDVNQSTDSRCSLRKPSRLHQTYLNPDCTPLTRSFLALKFATILSQSLSTGKYNFREQ